jgi:redox-sensitive bicupin YhaK (pirin superfamily)
MASNSGLVIRRSEERGHADHGWLNTYHTFNFANYYDRRFQEFGCLRVLNEDRVTSGQGFGTHPHSNYEIFSYVISGELTHRDSMGNKETIHRGEVQFTSAGSGIMHSEYNNHPSFPVHFLQIWVKPEKNSTKPTYVTKSFSDDQKRGKLCRIVSQKGENGSISILNDIDVYATLLEEGQEVKHKFGKERRGYVHVCKTGGSILLNDILLNEGDGLFITGMEDISIVGNGKQTTELLLFDLK